MRLRSLVAGLAAVVLTLAAPAMADPGDMAIGDAGAKVTIVEYASVSCPHCAHFDATVLPRLKTRYLDTGKARYVLRETPIHGEIDVAGFMIARCAGPLKYFTVIEDLFHGQQALFATKDVSTWLLGGVKAGGLTIAQGQACLDDTSGKAAFKARLDANMKPEPVESTPTIFINGKKVEGEEMTFDVVNAAIRKAVAPPRRKTAAKKKRG